MIAVSKDPDIPGGPKFGAYQRKGSSGSLKPNSWLTPLPPWETLTEMAT